MNNRDSETDGASSEPLDTPSIRNAQRGHACRFCRMRRIRCTTERPTCSVCQARKQECIYDYKKGPSKMQRLERQVKEISEQLKIADQPAYATPSSRPGDVDIALLPDETRDHLLRVFFDGMRILAQGFHQLRFYARLAGPVDERPHPCLLYAMCALAAHISTSELNQLGHSFYEAAAKAYEEATRRADRLLDAVRATTMLALYDFSVGRYHEGWLRSGAGNRLAISCGLHQIRSAVFKSSSLPPDDRVILVGLMRHVTFLLPAPSDSIDLGERIWAFWHVYMNDHGTAICTQWPVGIPDEIITTPLPQPLYKHEKNLIHELDNSSIGSTYFPLHASEASLITLTFQALSVLERGYKLQYAYAEAGAADAIDFGDWDSIMAFLRNTDSERTARKRTPTAFNSLKVALEGIELRMPVLWRTNWFVWDGSAPGWDHESRETRQDAYALHLVLGCAWMFLYDVFAFGAENEVATNIALRLAHAVKLIKNDTLSCEFESFTLMTWVFIAKILLREEKRLAESPGSLEVANAVDTCLEALTILGKRHYAAVDQADLLRSYRAASAEDTRFLREGLDHEHHVWSGVIRTVRRDFGLR